MPVGNCRQREAGHLDMQVFLHQQGKNPQGFSPVSLCNAKPETANRKPLAVAVPGFRPVQCLERILRCRQCASRGGLFFRSVAHEKQQRKHTGYNPAAMPERPPFSKSGGSSENHSTEKIAENTKHLQLRWKAKRTKSGLHGMREPF